MNYYSKGSAAARYPAGRTYFHPLVIARCKAFLGIERPVSRALDVGCGTGLSTVALLDAARSAVGVDSSAAMLGHAIPAPGRLAFVVGAAERLPFPDHAFDLITVSSACHWFVETAFLAEALRVLTSPGDVVVYDNYFRARPDPEDSFNQWHRGVCLRTFPNPPRARVDLGARGSERDGIVVVGYEEYQHEVGFTVERLVNYLMSQSNVIAAVAEGAETAESIRRWLTDGLRPFFAEGSEVAFRFGGPIWYLRKA